jgi:hypothetical protein
MNVDEKAALQWYEIAALGKYKKAYMPTALLYWQVFTKAKINKDKLLAKSYLWATIWSNSSERLKDKAVAKQLLVRIMEEMPETWQASLDEKSVSHLAVP